MFTVIVATTIVSLLSQPPTPVADPTGLRDDVPLRGSSIPAEIAGEVRVLVLEAGRAFLRDQADMVVNNIGEYNKETGRVFIKKDQNWGPAHPAIAVFLAMGVGRGDDGRLHVRDGFDAAGLARRAAAMSGRSGGSFPSSGKNVSAILGSEDEVVDILEVFLNNVGMPSGGAARLKDDQDWGVWEPGIRCLLAFGVQGDGKGRLRLRPEVVHAVEAAVRGAGRVARARERRV